MNQQFPVFTTSPKCHDCYKCVRQCPVKAIKIKNGKAEILPERCIVCGHCVEVCPTNAKRVRNDVARAKNLIETGKRVIATLAPSYTREFTPEEQKRLFCALKQIGFYGVSEVALGAEALSRTIGSDLKSCKEPKLVISSACPAAVEYISKYRNKYVNNFSKYLSPAQIHAQMLKEKYGEDTKIVFIGPCSAKKKEADDLPIHFDIALTFLELREWVQDEKIVLDKMYCTDNQLLLGNAGKSKIYPLEAGMNKMIENIAPNVNYIAISGIDSISTAFRDDAGINLVGEKSTFIEVLACKGGCIHGACLSKKMSSIEAKVQLYDEIRTLDEYSLSDELIDSLKMDKIEFPKQIDEFDVSSKKIKEVLVSIGKKTIEEELNCGGCGYQNCKSFAKAIIEKKAEPSMCLSYLKKRAEEQTNAIMHFIPAGLVLLDSNLTIIECNEHFTRIFKDDIDTEIIEINPTLQGARLARIVPIEDKFSSHFDHEHVFSTTIKYGNKIIDMHIFPVTKNEVIGGFFQDITNTELRHEEISTLAQTVITKNLDTVQEIACKLGENMAETEILLRTLVRGFSSEKIKKLNFEEKIKDEK